MILLSIALYPGSFDPVTYGHLDIIKRASELADTLIVGILDNPEKDSFFTTDEKLFFLKSLTEDMPNVSVLTFSGLTVKFAELLGAKIIIRGLRAVTDFEYEFQMALTNRSINSEVETLFISTSTKYLYLSSSIVKQVAAFSGEIDEMVPPLVKEQLIKRFQS